MAEHIALRFNWDDVKHYHVTDILGRNSRIVSDGSACWDTVAICIEGRAVSLSVEPDTDQIEVSMTDKPSGEGWEPISSFSFAQGQPLGWCWVGINSQGYKDSFTLAFGDVVPLALQPRCTFVAEASSLICYDLAPHLP